MTPHQMLDALSRQTGAALAFNGDGLCRLRFDGRFIVDLEVTDDEDAIYLYARLGTLPAGEQGRELMARMMRAHCLGRESGNTLFGLDGEEIMAFARVAAAEAGEGTLFTALEDFLDVLAHCDFGRSSASGRPISAVTAPPRNCAELLGHAEPRTGPVPHRRPQGITAAGNPTPACPVATAGEGRHAAAHNHIHNEGGRHARTSAGNADTLHQS